MSPNQTALLSNGSVPTGGTQLQLLSVVVFAQKANETTAYFVLEHAPDTCDSCERTPPNGKCTFENINVEVEGKAATPQWTSVKGGSYSCKSKATIVDPRTIEFTWDANSYANNVTVTQPGRVRFPEKWAPRVF